MREGEEEEEWEKERRRKNERRRGGGGMREGEEEEEWEEKRRRQLLSCFMRCFPPIVCCLSRDQCRVRLNASRVTSLRASDRAASSQARGGSWEHAHWTRHVVCVSHVFRSQVALGASCVTYLRVDVGHLTWRPESLVTCCKSHVFVYKTQPGGAPDVDARVTLDASRITCHVSRVATTSYLRAS